MSTINSTYQFFNKPVFRHLLFWLVVFLFYVMTTSSEYYTEGIKEIFETYFVKVGIQILIAYLCLLVLLPHTLKKGNWVYLGLGLLFIILLGNSLYLLGRIYYLEPTYPGTYISFFNNCKDPSFTGRLFSIPFLAGKGLFLLQPAILLIAIKFYRNQQRLLELNEQKKTAELTALKNQLNPHFLFNTLNNLYALSLEKSDLTPEVIAKLAEMLDYLLYRCNDKFVPLKKEINLIENYIALEKIRFGKRLSLNFDYSVSNGVKIAPLLLLTFVENAFKHGIHQELKTAFIDIDIKLENEHISFQIKNTKPNGDVKCNGEEAIGLINVKKQLALLYPDSHQLHIEEDKRSYEVVLKLAKK